MEFLYVCLFSSGHIKVGRSVDPLARIACHAERVACVGVELLAHEVFPVDGPAIAAETALLTRCRSIATWQGGEEWFAGLDFAATCDLAAECSHIKTDPARGFRGFLMAMKPADRDEFAEKCETSRGQLQNIAYGRTCSVELAVAIEVHSGGRVRREELRPHDWLRIWPELADRQQS